MNKIKIYLLLVLSFIFIINIENVSYAWTWNEFIDFCGNAKNTTQTGTALTIANTIYNNRTTIQNNIETFGENLNEYKNFIAKESDTGTSKVLYLSKNDVTIEYNKLISGHRYPLVITLKTSSIGITLDTFTTFRNNSQSVSYGKIGAVGLIENQSNYGTDDNYFSNKYIRAEILRTNLNGLPEPYQFANATVGYTYYRNTYNWYIIQLVNASIKYTRLDYTIDDQDDFIYYSISLTNEMLNNIDKGENCYLIYGTETTSIYQSESFTLDFTTGPGTSGGMTNASGEIIFNIDLAGIENRLDNIDGTIKSGDAAILNQLKQNESGDQQRFDYWVGFFNPSGDNVSNNIINSSGDIFGISYENIDDYGILNFVLNLFNSLYQLLFNNTSDVSLNLGMFGSLNSADFAINNSEIQNFLSQVLNPTVILITIFFYYRFIKNVVTLNLDVLDKYDIDNNIKLF